MPILYAASPVEIEAKADTMSLPGAARAAALALFHDLTSREELTALALPAVRDGRQGGAAWPAHLLLLGTPAELAPVLGALRLRPDAAELVGDSTPEEAAPGILFVMGEQAGFTGVLLACGTVEQLEGVVRELGLAATQ